MNTKTPKEELDTLRDAIAAAATDAEDPRWCDAFTGRALPEWVIRDDLASALRTIVQAQNDHAESCARAHDDTDMTATEEAFFDALGDTADTLYAALNPDEAWDDLQDTNTSRASHDAEPLTAPEWLATLSGHTHDRSEG